MPRLPSFLRSRVLERFFAAANDAAPATSDEFDDSGRDTLVDPPRATFGEGVPRCSDAP